MTGGNHLKMPLDDKKDEKSSFLSPSGQKSLSLAGVFLDSSTTMIKEVRLMSDYEILMIVFTVIGLLIALYNCFRKK